MAIKNKSRYNRFKIVSILCLSIFAVYALTILKPFSYNHFSLIDDGELFFLNDQTIKDCLSHHQCNNLRDHFFEREFGRFRPTRWIVNEALFLTTGPNPTTLHALRILVGGGTLVLLLSSTMKSVGISALGFQAFSTLLLISTYSFAENFIRLGPDEPIYVIFLATFLYLMIGEKKSKNRPKSFITFSTFILFLALTTREAAIAILPAVLGTEFIFNRNNMLKKMKQIFLPVSTLIIGIALSRTEGTYGSNYNFDLSTITANLMGYSQIIFRQNPIFALTVPLSLTFLFSEKNQRVKKIITLFSLLFLSTILIYLPWKYVLDRYMLLAYFCLSILAGYSMFKMWNFITYFFFKRNLLLVQSIYIFLAINLLSISIVNGIVRSINYSNWYAQYVQFESDQVDAINASLVKRCLVIDAKDNINNWEVWFEIPIHLKYLYTHDSEAIFSDNVQMCIDNNLLLLSRTGMDRHLNDDLLEQLNLVQSEKYITEQINPIAARNEMLVKPLSTILRPPLTTPIEYSWNLYTARKEDLL